MHFFSEAVFKEIPPLKPDSLVSTGEATADSPTMGWESKYTYSQALVRQCVWGSPTGGR